MLTQPPEGPRQTEGLPLVKYPPILMFIYLSSLRTKATHGIVGLTVS